MKHTTEELLLAAQVRQIAIGLRIGNTPEDLQGPALAEWRKANPLKNWLAPAMEDLDFVADFIASRHQS